MQITRSSVDTAKGPADWFTGDVYLDAVAAATCSLRAERHGALHAGRADPLAPAPAEPDPLRHRGRRPVPAPRRPVEVIRPGDRVLFEADEEHWHGAAPNRLMVHLAINEADADASSTGSTPSPTRSTPPPRPDDPGPLAARHWPRGRADPAVPAPFSGARRGDAARRSGWGPAPGGTGRGGRRVIPRVVGRSLHSRGRPPRAACRPGRRRGTPGQWSRRRRAARPCPPAASRASARTVAGSPSTKWNVVSSRVNDGLGWWVRTKTGVWKGGRRPTSHARCGRATGRGPGRTCCAP